MKAVLLSLVFAASALAQGQLTINTPANAVECQPLLITWSGGQSPYFVSVLPGNNPTGQAVVDFGQQNGTSVTWLVNQQANIPLGLTLRDNTGQVAQSASFTVNPGSSSDCLSQTVSFSGGTAAAPSPTGGAAAPATTSGAAAPSATAPTNAGTTGAASGTSSRATSATSARASATSSGAASANFASISTAGIIGAVLAAFFA